MDLLTHASLLIGAFLVVVFAVIAVHKKLPINLASATVLFLSGTGIVGGIRVFLFAFHPKVIELARQENIDVNYIIVGGIAIVWVSVLSAVDVFRNLHLSILQNQRQLQSYSQPTFASSQLPSVGVQSTTPVQVQFTQPVSPSDQSNELNQQNQP